jgi:hypothetical protein
MVFAELLEAGEVLSLVDRLTAPTAHGFGRKRRDHFRAS